MASPKLRAHRSGKTFKYTAAAKPLGPVLATTPATSEGASTSEVPSASTNGTNDSEAPTTQTPTTTAEAVSTETAEASGPAPVEPTLDIFETSSELSDNSNVDSEGHQWAFDLGHLVAQWTNAPTSGFQDAPVVETFHGQPAPGTGQVDGHASDVVAGPTAAAVKDNTLGDPSSAGQAPSGTHVPGGWDSSVLSTSSDVIASPTLSLSQLAGEPTSASTPAQPAKGREVRRLLGRVYSEDGNSFHRVIRERHPGAVYASQGSGLAIGSGKWDNLPLSDDRSVQEDDQSDHESVVVTREVLDLTRDSDSDVCEIIDLTKGTDSDDVAMTTPPESQVGSPMRVESPLRDAVFNNMSMEEKQLILARAEAVERASRKRKEMLSDVFGF